MSTSRPGKHGHAKVKVVGLDIFNNKKKEDVTPSTHKVLVPEVTRREYIVSPKLCLLPFSRFLKLIFPDISAREPGKGRLGVAVGPKNE